MPRVTAIRRCRSIALILTALTSAAMRHRTAPGNRVDRWLLRASVLPTGHDGVMRTWSLSPQQNDSARIPKRARSVDSCAGRGCVRRGCQPSRLSEQWGPTSRQDKRLAQTPILQSCDRARARFLRTQHENSRRFGHPWESGGARGSERRGATRRSDLPRRYRRLRTGAIVVCALG